MKNPASILITGASSGIGAALAMEYAAPGVTLLLGGRDAARLEAVAGACRERGAAARVAALDVTERAACEAWIAAADETAPLDLVIANAGISAGTGGARPLTDEAPDMVRRIFAVNLDGLLNTVLPAFARMRPRRRGQIAIMSSLAGFWGAPGAAAYCATKAAQRVLGEGLRGAFAAEGIEVCVICPGFVHTPMTAGNDFPMPFAMEPERAARIIRRGLARNRARIAFPWPLYALVRLGQAMPVALMDRLMRRLPRKG